MVQVVQHRESDAVEPMGIFQWMAHNWALLLIGIICIGLAIAIFVILRRMEDERKERDDVLYAAYKNIMRSAYHSADQSRIRNHYSLINLLWLGLPIIRREHSAKIVNYVNENMGFYRGHCTTQDGYLNIIAYKSKKWLIIEDHFLIRCPIMIKKRVYVHDRNGQRVRDKKGNYAVTVVKKALTGMIVNVPNGDLKIKCSNLENDNYFFYPVYLDSDGIAMDLRKEIGSDLVDVGYDQMLSRVLTTGSQMTEKAMLHNPYVQYNQKSPEKTKVEQEMETN